jgi:hypothetical protein
MHYHIIVSIHDQVNEIVTWIDGQIIRETATFQECERVRRKLFHAVWSGDVAYVPTQGGPNFGFLPY